MEIASRANNFHYNKSLKEFAKKNRQSMTKSAACMWKYLLSGRQMLGYQFRRERPILNYIVDFVCLELLLIVEVDGATHESEEAEIKDAYRDSRLSEVGFTVLRFSSWEVLNNMVDVDVILCDWINTHAQVPPPGPRQRGKS
jgi:very-short-patch-repair endonuclease